MHDLTDDARIDQVISDLDEIFANTPSKLFIEGMVQDWTNHPFVRGSYSHPTVGTFPFGGVSLRGELAKPVGSTLYFAGEATNLTAAATVPGAMQTGDRAATEIDDAMGGPPAAGTPIVGFLSSATEGNAPLGIDFTDESTEMPTGWSWDFGDGNTSTVQNPTHEYATPGTYTVNLTSTNASGTRTRVFPNLIAVPEPTATAQILVSFACVAALHFRRKVASKP